jgi:hypothetical protein
VAELVAVEAKVCTKCGETKPVEEFYKKSGRRGRMAVCKTCWNARNKAWLEAHPGRGAEYKRRWEQRNPGRSRNTHLLRRYGVTAEEVDAREAEQEGRCSICGKARPLVLDHDHEDERPRGLVCQPCNVVLGAAGDDVEVLRRAIAYLEAGGTWEN